MLDTPFYHQSIKKVVSSFAAIFNDLCILDSENKIKRIPIQFSQKQKFVELYAQLPDLNESNNDIALPVIGFEIASFNYDSTRMVNPINIQHRSNDKDSDEFKYMLTSIPYDIGIEMFIAVNSLDDGYKIVEQIVPFFTPNLTITIRDLPEYEINTNITFDLTSCSQDVEYEGGFDTTRIIQWNLSFIAKTWFHSNPRSVPKIKKFIANLSEKDMTDIFDKIVVP